MKSYKLCGLTGQTGAGKSTVSKLFADKGAYIINADLLVRELYQPHSLCLRLISAEFGKEVINSDGSLNRKILAEYAFKDQPSIDKLNRLVHPFVTALFIERLREASKSHKLIIYDAPQLFESGCDVLCDSIVGVISDKAVRLERICQRDNITVNQAESRMSVQRTEDFYKKNTDLIIENNGDLQALKNSFESIYKRLING